MEGVQRVYSISASAAPGVLTHAKGVVEGSFSFGALDAAKKWAQDNLPAYQVIPGGIFVQSGERRFEAIDHDAQLGAVIYVREQ